MTARLGFARTLSPTVTALTVVIWRRIAVFCRCPEFDNTLSLTMPSADWHTCFRAGQGWDERGRGGRLNVNDVVTVKTDGEVRREGVILAVEPFQEGTMYLIALEDYPEGIWFFNELNSPEGVFVERRQPADQ